MLRLLLVLLFIVVPIAELAILIQVGQLIGIWWTIALLVADAVLGSMLARSQGRAAWRRFNEALQQRAPAGAETVDGALVLFGGALLLTPGFIIGHPRARAAAAAHARDRPRHARAAVRRADGGLGDARRAVRRSAPAAGLRRRGHGGRGRCPTGSSAAGP